MAKTGTLIGRTKASRALPSPSSDGKNSGTERGEAENGATHGGIGMTVDVLSAVDVKKLSVWMGAQGLGVGPISNVRKLAGGTQNILLRFSHDGRDYVLRRTAAKPRPGADRLIEREAQVLSALADSEVPHPRLIASCCDPELLGSAFYLMEPVEGFNPTNTMPTLHSSDPAIRRAMGFSLVNGAVALSRIDPELPALKGFGNPENFLGRQVDRWRSALDDYAQIAEWPGLSELPGIGEIGAYLDDNQPTAFTPGLMHGDYHFANVMFSPDGPDVVAIVDWELSTIGDPLLDLAWILACWRGPPDDEVDLIRVQPWSGFPDPAELVDHYAERTGRDLGAFDWYRVLACYKLAIIIEGTFVRSLQGKAPAATGTWFHTSARQLLRRARKIIGN